MSFHHPNHMVPVGRVGGPGLLFGGVGLALAVAMQMLGWLARGDEQLKQVLLDPLFHGSISAVLAAPVLVVMAAIFCWGLAFAVLDSACTWRRMVVGVTMVVIVLAMVPTFAVWDVYFSPIIPLIAVFWTWFCTMMYVNHHVMPCDGLGFQHDVSSPRRHALTRPEVADVAEIAMDVPDPNAKYQPKKRERNQGDG
ncbi:MAG: hypothetical protein KJO21_00845 [Verrucomicrobiae bacterium]|nr:hypothetical protein [Verrucomicrobiae bacterium]NNJ42081.1 hypothetical protein [Akkermansiaceae bacterium]